MSLCGNYVALWSVCGDRQTADGKEEAVKPIYTTSPLSHSFRFHGETYGDPDKYTVFSWEEMLQVDNLISL